MNEFAEGLPLPAKVLLRVEAICDRFEEAWKAGQRPQLEDYLGDFAGPVRVVLLRELLVLELAYRRRQGETPSLADYRPRFPLDAELLDTVFRAAPVVPTRGDSGLAHQLGIGAHSEEMPALGRYRVTARLGSGGFGMVYRAYDDQLRRDVAIKVPHPDRLAHVGNSAAFLAEAQILARLDHPHIVPVYDAVCTNDGLCYVVSKFIDGGNLAQLIGTTRLSCLEAVELAATVAEALHHAHTRRLVHRDVKPSNILIDKSGKVYVADFGLALKEEDYGKGEGSCGTPAYMSPEQANGEGHRVDGRSDIFSLGAVFYELLTGWRPFRAASKDVLEQIVADEPRPPRQVQDSIPKELERICLKALAKRAAERYTTAKDMADDLRQFLAQSTEGEKSALRSVGRAAGASSPLPATPPVPSPVPASDSQPVRIVPKGLRSFDAHDADFFLELLPGPRDRDGLPENIRFWKNRIEDTDPDMGFTVGLIYGPSGCGKSSLVKAGLLPRLSGHVIAVYFEATAEGTEIGLLNRLRQRCPALPPNLDLKGTLAELRRGPGVGQAFLPAGRQTGMSATHGQKVLIVLDQFEQWLHAGQAGSASDRSGLGLVQALRQCDGVHLQCVVLVRDDFWMAATRFMHELEIRLVEGHNSAAVDLFPPRHAEKVLSAFGRAFGSLPETSTENSPDQQQFVQQAVRGLAQDGKVVCVRLALFAEMMKGKIWTPATLKEVGGTEGIGATFLEETFSAATAPPEHRYHQRAARAVLKALLPEGGTDIKGHVRSREDLLATSGYGSRLRDFDRLLGILDGELRLITPTDPEGVEISECEPGALATGVRPSSRVADASGSPTTRYYQLTHDYLVSSLRDWLTRKQKETRRGRAELLLTDRTSVWNARPETRQLPSLPQWCCIRWLTAKKNWTPVQRKMMRNATRYHGIRGLALVVLMLVLTLIGWDTSNRIVQHNKATHAAGLVRGLLDADIGQVQGLIHQLDGYRRWTDPLLRGAYAEAEQAGKEAVTHEEKDRQAHRQLRASLALLPVDVSQTGYLVNRLLDAAPQEVPILRDGLARHKDELLDKLWPVVEKPNKSKEHQRLRAAAALAKYDPEGERWGKAGALVVKDLVGESPVFLGHWSEAFRPVKNRLVPHLSEIFRDRQPERAAERSLATSLLADYAAEQPQVLADLLMDADDKQFAVIYLKFQERGAEGLPVLTSAIDTKLPPELASSDKQREELGKQQANAAVALLRMNQPAKVWPLLKHSPDPRVRSYLIHRLYPLGADAGAILKRLAEEPDVTIRRALLLSLGEYGEKELSPEARQAVSPKLQEIYCSETDPGLHASAEWLLRQWQQEAWLRQVNDGWAKDKQQRQQRLQGIQQLVTKNQEKAPLQWFVNGQGQTMVVVPGPVKFLMGSPATEVGRYDREDQHNKRIGRTFAIAAKAVTVAEYRKFSACYGSLVIEQGAGADDSPVTGMDWFQAVAYCNMLSKQEGLPPSEWCYEPLLDPNAKPALAGSTVGLLSSSVGSLVASCGLYPGRTDPAYKDGMKMAPNYLHRTGYRLPTEAEMEYATRAGAATSRCFGETDELLEKYARYAKNAQERKWPVGSKKPNDFGLFDIHGNVFTWCQENFGQYPQIKGSEIREDKEAELLVKSTSDLVLRGGSFRNYPPLVRSAYRSYDLPTYRDHFVGFRVARTMPFGGFVPSPPTPAGGRK
jgi:serine/threonine protein kinase/formylglycine-generating enzyme required for sulfatase activity